MANSLSILLSTVLGGTILILAACSTSNWGNLMGAIYEGDVQRLRGLLASGVDPRRSCEDCLSAAAERGNYQIVLELINAKADVNSRDEFDGETALHRAANRGHLDIVQLLINNHANLDVQDWIGVTPLMGAALGRRLEITKLLINAGANVTIKSKGGETAFDWAFSGLVGPLLTSQNSDDSWLKSYEIAKIIKPSYISPRTLVATTNDQSVLAGIAQEGNDMTVRKKAIGKLLDQQKVAALAITMPPVMRSFRFSVPVNVAIGGELGAMLSTPNSKQEVVIFLPGGERVTNTSPTREVTKLLPSHELNLYAVEALTDIDALKYVQNNATAEVVRKFAEKRLATLSINKKQ